MFVAASCVPPAILKGPSQGSGRHAVRHKSHCPRGQQQAKQTLRALGLHCEYLQTLWGTTSVNRILHEIYAAMISSPSQGLSWCGAQQPTERQFAIQLSSISEQQRA